MTAPATPLKPAPDANLAARIVDLADQCVLCGLCLPHCPTYTLDRNEGESPRGRIMLMKGLAEARIEPGPGLVAHLDHCLGCRHCERVCPAQVRYGELLVAGRTLQRARVPAGWRQRALEWLLPRRRALAAAIRLAGWLRPLPGPWRRLPRPESAPAPASTPAIGPPRGRVALFTGCLGPHHDAAAAQAAIRLLSALGWEVSVPRAQRCCGALHRHAGAAAGAAALEAANRAAFADDGVEAILTLSSGCHESVALACAQDPAAPRVQDALGFIAADARLPSLRWRAARAGVAVALHIPCTQRNVVGSAGRIAPLLQRIPGLALQALPDGCCGAAGSHMLVAPERADALRGPVLDAIVQGGATTLCSSNVGCRMHLAAGLETREAPVRAQHPLQLLADHLE